MKLKHTLAALGLALVAMPVMGDELLSYAVPGGNSGLRLAWRASSDAEWQSIGRGFNFVKSDFGPWGSHKKMFSPRLMVNASDSTWTCTWYAAPDGSVTALATSPDLVKWAPQRYFASELDLPRDMRPLYPIARTTATIDGTEVSGYSQEVPHSLIESLQKYVEHRAELSALYSQHAVDDSKRFAGLKDVTFSASPVPDASYPISDKLIGIFFEDINYGADGGLYAELVQNRDFEYSPNENNAPDWNSTHSWSTSGQGSFKVDTVAPIHPNNLHYLTVNGPLTLTNAGYDGISLKKGDKYRLSFFIRTATPLSIQATLTDDSGKTVGRTSVKTKGNGEWTKYTATIKASKSVSGAKLNMIFPAGTDAAVDMVSLFPYDTFKGHENGLRRDLAQTLADLKPRFVRFPGGCVAHGNGIDNIYDWKGSIGPLEARKPLRNIWSYHQTRGLGYHEYFQFCEDMGAEPLPVLAAGVPCQNSGIAAHHSHAPLTTFGQQGGIPMEEMDAYVQDVLDLIEYANGDVNTTWGAKRAEAGHPEPFNLKYIGIGNEDLISEVFIPRFRMIYDAVRAKYPDIIVVGTVGPFYEGADYDEGWRLAHELNIPMVDEHYYVDPSWMIHNQDYYDNYKRNATKVYLGEYAAHLPGRPNNLETALASALYLTSVERNADVVAMTSYAPLLAKEGHTQWKPDMIFFNNDSVKVTPDYHVQKMYGNNAGTRYVPAPLKVNSTDRNVVNRIGMSTVLDEATGEYVIKLANLLPVTVTGNVDLSKLGIAGGKAKGLRLTGAPADTKLAPEEVTVEFPAVSLPPYSFTVVRVKR